MRIEKEITLLKFRDNYPKRIVAIVKRNPNLPLANKKTSKYYVSNISRSNVKIAAKRRSITRTYQQQAKKG